MILIGLLAAIALPAQAEIPLEASNIISYAQLERGGHTSTLQLRQPLTDGDIIRTGDARASVELHFVRDGVVTLGGNSQLFVYGASPPSLGRGDVLRIQLVHGELTLEAYPPSNTVPKDYRVNVGPLQVRALGADMWAYSSGDSQIVCLHQGAVEITGSAGEQRLDFVGDCVKHKNGEPLQVMPGGETELKDRMLTAEQSAAKATMIAVVPADEPSAKLVDALLKAPAPAATTVAVVPASPPAAAPAPIATPKKAVSNSAPSWVIVMATARSRTTADDLVYKFGKRTLRTTVRETGKGAQPFSVTFGDFATRKEAEQFAQKLQRKYHIKIVRIVALS